MLARPVHPANPESTPTTPEAVLGPALVTSLDRLDVLSRKVFAGKLPGERRSKRRGQSVEFHDYRTYAPGDDLRHIDWNVYARFDRLFIKVFREEEDLAVHLILDASASMHAGNPDKIGFAQRLAVALAYIGLVNRNRVVASIIGAPGRGNVQSLAPLRGRKSIRRVLQFLVEHVRPPPERGVATHGTFDMTDALRRLSLSRSGRGVAVLISDFLASDDLGTGLSYLGTGAAGPAYDTHCVQILSPSELDPSLEEHLAGDLRLIDAESGRSAEVTVTPALVRLYRSRLERHCSRLRTICHARGMGYTLVRTDADLDRIILDSLRRRRLVG